MTMETRTNTTGVTVSVIQQMSLVLFGLDFVYDVILLCQWIQVYSAYTQREGF